jgi:hypothetical protein
MKKYLIPSTILVFLLCGLSCQEQHASKTVSEFTNCRYQAPEAIFSSAIPAISQHEFTLKDGIGVEKALIDRAVQLTLIQTGCDKITQEFEFSWQGNYNEMPPSYWVGQCAEKFYLLGNLGASYLSFRSIGKAIEHSAAQIQLNTPVELQPGVVLSIEPTADEDKAILLVTLSQEG